MESVASCSTSVNTTTNEDFDKLKAKYFGAIDEIFNNLEKFDRLPKTYADVQGEIDKRKVILDDLKNARDSNGATQSDGTPKSNGTN